MTRLKMLFLKKKKEKNVSLSEQYRQKRLNALFQIMKALSEK